MHRLITDLGYEAHQRDNWYRLLKLNGKWLFLDLSRAGFAGVV